MEIYGVNGPEKKGQEKSLSLDVFLTVSKMNRGPITIDHKI